MKDDCIFCKIIAGEIPADKLYEDDDVLAFCDIRPQAPKHILVIPKIHIDGPADANEEHDALMGKIMRIGSDLAKREQIGEGYRFVVNNGESAGQTVFHMHLHVLGGRRMLWPPG